jgi:hypothetical protein
LPGVERDHHVHTVLMILRDIFDHSGNIAHIVAPQMATLQRSSISEKTTRLAIPRS